MPDRGALAIVAAAVTWGTIGVATKAIFGLANTNPLSIGVLRLAGSALCLAVVARWLVGPGWLGIARVDRGAVIGIGVAMALYQVTYFAAIPPIGVALSVLLALGSAPVFVAAIVAIAWRAWPTGRQLGAMAGALGGALLLVWPSDVGQASRGDANWLGVGLALAAGLSYALVVVLSRVVAAKYHPLPPIAIGFAVGALTLLPFAALTGLHIDYPPMGWALLAYLSVVPTAIGYGCFLLGLRRVDATTASLITLLEPLTSATLAWLWFGESLTALGWLGAALLLGAIAWLQTTASRR